MNPSVLFVDDDPNLLEAIQRGLRKQFSVATALGGELALQRMEESGPYSVIVADMQMPKMSGLEFLREVQQRSPTSVRMMLTGNSDLGTAINAVNDGRVFQYLTKPCPVDKLAPALQAALDQFQRQEAERELLEKTLGGAVNVLMEILSLADPISFDRSQRLQEYVRGFTANAKVNVSWEIELAAQLSQIGYATVPAPVVERYREDKTLTPSERQIIDLVPETGARLIEKIPRLEQVAKIVRHQQRRFDGTKFPSDNLAGEEIPIGSRILKVLSDLIDLECRGLSKFLSFQRMHERVGWYDLQVLAAASRWCDIAPFELSEEKIGNPVLTRIDQLCLGQVLAEDLRTRGGLLIVKAKTKITPMLLVKLLNFSSIGSIENSILVHGHD